MVAIEKQPKPIALLLLGAIVGGLLLTKINLAAFIMLPLILGALRATGDHVWLRAVHGVVLAFGLLMPIVLMAPLFRLEWVVRCICDGTILAALVVWSSSVIPKILTIRHWGFFLAGFTTVVLLTLCATMAGGTTALEILRATVLQSSDFAQNFYYPAPVSGAAIAIAAISVAYAIFYALSQRRAANREAAMARVMRLKAGMGILGCLAIAISAVFGNPWGTALPELMFQFLVPFAWLLMVTDETFEQQRPLTRGVLGLMAAFMVLYAFPVAGTQTMLASLLPAVMLPVLLNDAIRHPSTQQVLKGCFPAALRKVAWHRGGAKTIAYALLLAMLASQTVSKLRVYQSMEPLNLPGTSFVRTDHDTAQLLRWVVGELVKCPAFYSIPSVPSLYFWTDHRAPTEIQYDIFGLLSFEQQRHAISDLERNDVLCILTIPALPGVYSGS